VDPKASDPYPRGPAPFSTTRWSLVLGGARPEDTEAAQTALAELCRIYWRPIYAYICRRGYSIHDAEDLTQDFFVMILEKNWLQHADPERGRFRSLLLRSVQNFVGHESEKRRTQKRGGKVNFVSWDEWTAEAPSRVMIAGETLQTASPDHVFDLRWALTVVERALQRLRAECEGKGKAELFDALNSYLTSDPSEISYSSLGKVLGVSEPTIKKQLHNLRRRYRWLIHHEVAHTVGKPDEIEDEVRHLCKALATAI
jgi:RNA polymerase sigma factor (sigma-70 family)